MKGSDAFEAMLAKHLIVARIIWIGFTGAIFVYAFAGYVVATQAAPSETGMQAELLRYIMSAVGLMMAAVALGLKLVVFSRARIHKRLDTVLDLEEMARDRKAGREKQAYLDQLKSLAEAEKKIVGLFTWYLVRYIAVLAIIESVAILGLVLAVLTYQPMQMLPFLVATLLLNARMIGHPRGIVKYARAVLQEV